MESLEISKNKTVKAIPSYFGGDDEEDIPDMADYEEADNVIETDAVSSPIYNNTSTHIHSWERKSNLNTKC